MALLLRSPGSFRFAMKRGRPSRGHPVGLFRAGVVHVESRQIMFQAMRSQDSVIV